MSEQRPRALVTAAVRGPGLVLLGELADLTLDSWLDQPTLRIYNAEQLAERVAAEGASIVVVESDRCAGPALRPAPGGRVQLPGRSEQRGRGRRHRRRGARAAGPGTERRRAWPSWPWPCSSPPPAAWWPPTPTCATARSTRTAPSPTSASGPGSWPGAPPAWSGSGAVGRALRVAAAGPGPRGHRLRPLRRRAHREPRRAAGPGRRGLDARAGHPGDDRDDRGRAVRLDARRRGLPQHGPGRSCTTPTHWSRRCGRARCRPPGSTTSRGSPWPSTIR